jgi:hypothetical protein
LFGEFGAVDVQMHRAFVADSSCVFPSAFVGESAFDRVGV